MRILSIDPGYERVGIAVLEKKGGGKESLLFSNCFKTSPKFSHPERLRLIGEELDRLIAAYAPDAFAIETLYFSTNTKTAMRVSEARGVMLFSAAKRSIPVFEHNPMEIKSAVAGYGKSRKEEVTKMVRLLVEIDKEIKHDDEYDAIAVGLACFATMRARSIGAAM